VSERVAAVLGPGGLFAQHFEGYESRPQQLRIATEVERAIEAREHLLVDAPTGCGKSISYLVPAIECAVAQGKRVVVVTANIALQEQIVDKDLPTIRRILPTPFSFAIAKGRANYLCLAAFEEAQREVSIKGAAKALGPGADRWSEAEGWAMQTERGDVSELDFDLGPLRRHLTVSAEECVGPHCPRREECHSERAKKLYWSSQVIVTNYAMFYLDIALRGDDPDASGVLPAWDVAVLDEAHSAGDLSRSFFGFRVTEGMVKSLVRLSSSCAEVDGQLARDVGAEASSYFAAAHRYRTTKRRDLPPERRDDHVYDVRLKRPGEGPDPSALCALLRDLGRSLGRAAEVEEESVARVKLKNGEKKCALLTSQLEAAHAVAEPARCVYCLELEGANGERVAVVSKLIYPRDVLKDALFAPEGRSVVLCSATLAVNGSFAFVREELGIDKAREVCVGSPFDYARNARLIVPVGLPSPTEREEHERAVAERLVEVVCAARGRTLALFTSYRGLRVARDALARLRGSQRASWGSLLVQGDAPRSELVRRFCEEVGSVLLGTESFAEGVDVPGESLSVVVVDRLPFAPPDDPVYDAVDAMSPRGAFFTWSLPRAVTALRQRAGRLIRRATDRGVVVVLDDRVVTKGYGASFTRALAPMPISRDLSLVRSFLFPEEAESPSPVDEEERRARADRWGSKVRRSG
jgi:ATP-dependent DNA helicase DinG